MIALVTVPALYNGAVERTAAYPNMVSLVLLGAEVLITAAGTDPHMQSDPLPAAQHAGPPSPARRRPGGCPTVCSS